jgi:hypothetical protein
VICTVANDRLLLWNARATNAKGLDAVMATLDSIVPLATETTARPDDSKSDLPGQPSGEQRQNVAAGVTMGLLVKKVTPFYPPDARAAHIQGTVTLQAKINKNGDIADLELVDGPIRVGGLCRECRPSVEVPSLFAKW